MSLSLIEIRKIFKQISDEAHTKQAQVELLIESGESLSLGSQKQKLEKFDQKTFLVAGFRVLLKGYQGYSATENFSEESLKRAFQEAFQNAQDLNTSNLRNDHDQSDNKNLVWSMANNSESYKQNLDLDFGEQGSLEQKIQLALNLESLTLKEDPRIFSVPQSRISEGFIENIILNSEGLDRSYRERYFMSYCYPIAKQSGQTKMFGESIVARRLKDLDVKLISQKSAQKAISLLGATKLETGNYPVLLDREVAQSFIGQLKSAFSAKRVFEKKSPLADKLGQKIGVDFLTIYDDALDLRGGGVRPFDSEGNASKKVAVIENGILKNFLTNREFAAKMNLPLTAHASRSATSEMAVAASTFIIPPGTKKIEELLSFYPKVIHIVELSAFHSGFNMTTGDFSLPGQGFLFENGKKVKAVDQFVMSGNIFELLYKIDGFSDETGPLGNGVICSDILLNSMSFA